MGVDRPDRAQADFLGQQIIGNRLVTLGADAQVRFEKKVQSVAHRTLHGVLHRHHPVVTGPFLHLTENLPDAGLGYVGNGISEVTRGGQVGKGGLGTQVGHPLGGLDGAGGGNDVDKDVVQDVGV